MRPKRNERELKSAESAPVPLSAHVEQRRRQAAGLAILALLILVFSLWRAGRAAVFPTGWWHVW